MSIKLGTSHFHLDLWNDTWVQAICDVRAEDDVDSQGRDCLEIRDWKILSIIVKDHILKTQVIPFSDLSPEFKDILNTYSEFGGETQIIENFKASEDL